MIEDPGPWGYDALAHNRVPKDLFGELKSWADSVSARVILVRRGARLVGTPRKLFLANSHPAHGWLTEFDADNLDALLSVDRAAFKAEDVPGKKIENLYLVCTHGRHDRCCSVRGNPVARALCARYGATAWECSHIGGDRFAANVVCLPRGAYFGRVPAADAERLTEEYALGILDLELFRGWSFFPFAVQAAEIVARRELDLTRIDDLELHEWSKQGDGHVAVRMSAGGHGPLDVSVVVRKSDDEFYLTCRAEQVGRPPVFDTTVRL